jgi:hypothetical protein
LKALLIPLAVLLAAAAPAAADDVYLANGQVFEDVVARRDGDKVRIRLEHGEMGVPASWVVRIEESETPLAEYLRRKAVLAPGAPAGEWLELARWARSQGLPEGAREAALQAAALDPELEGLAPILQAAGFVFDQDRYAWVTEAQLMTSRGFVRVGDTWVSAEALAERRRVADEERAAAERQAREDRLDQVITLLALAQLQEAREDRERAEAPAYTPYGAALLGAPVAVFPGTFHPGRVHRPPPRHRPPGDGHGRPPVHPPEQNRGAFSYDALAGRQPGSIIPLAQDPGAERGRQ